MLSQAATAPGDPAEAAAKLRLLERLLWKHQSRLRELQEKRSAAAIRPPARTYYLLKPVDHPSSFAARSAK